MVNDRVPEGRFPPGPQCARTPEWANVWCQVPLPAQGGDRGDPLLAVSLPCPFSLLKNGELIYGCKDARSPAADWSELAHHLKPFFFPSNGLASGPHCTRAVIRELVRVITRVLLSGSDKGWASAMRLGPGSRGPCVCEASPFRRSLRHQGRPGGRQASRPSLDEACMGPAWRHGASVGVPWALAGLPKASPCLSAPLGRLPFSSSVWICKLQHMFGL